MARSDAPAADASPAELSQERRNALPLDLVGEATARQEVAEFIDLDRASREG